MGTTIRPELSEKNPYWIEKHRYYELKHFCLQYPIWKKAYLALDGLAKRPTDLILFSNRQHLGDPTAKCAEARIFYSDRMDLVKLVAEETDAVLGTYILQSVTNGISYALKAALCSEADSHIRSGVRRISGVKSSLRHHLRSR